MYQQVDVYVGRRFSTRNNRCLCKSFFLRPNISDFTSILVHFRADVAESGLGDDLSVSKIVEQVQGAAVLQEIPGRKMLHNGMVTG